GEKVTVSFAGQSREAVAAEDGTWMVSLKEMPVCAQGRPLIFQGSETAQPIELKDVLVGEVWLAGGQSNMQTTMDFYKTTTQADINQANDPLLRMITIPNKIYKDQNSARPRWAYTTPQTVSGFSASAYYFAKNLRETLKVPVGIIACSIGGTVAEAWMSRKTLESSEDLSRSLRACEQYYQKTFASESEYNRLHTEYEKANSEWYRKRNAGEDPGPRPKEPIGPRYVNRPAGLYENMLTQTIPYTIKGVIWYQGESNAIMKNSFQYRNVFATLINEWRADFQNSDLPFLFVQLATYGPPSNGSPYWPELCDAQQWAEDHVKNTGMIVLSDGGDQANIHPHSKPMVGYRLSLLARHMVYGEKDLICRGPRLKKMKVKNGAVELTFKDIGSGLVLKPESVSAFEVCGKDGKYVPAEAVLVDGKIIVSSKEVPSPTNVRYGWRQFFVPTLYNVEGLPASAFRTDDFPLVSKDRYYLDDL
ncbi:MAG: sialate O-acetylesterase, partial [Kiritimatiellales bacterium]